MSNVTPTASRDGGAPRARGRWTAILGAVFIVAAFVPLRALAANPSADLDQCANGNPIQDPACPAANPGNSDWVNGNLNSSKSMYFEGDSIPYRMKFGNLSLGSHTVTIEWDTTKSSKHAIDYLTSFDRTVASANPCAGVGGCAASTTFPIPPNPQVTGSGVSPIAGAFRMYGGTVTAASPYSYADGTGFTGDKSARITVTFTAAVDNPVLAWGGHIATRQDWGSGNSAVSIPGSPFHMRLIDLDGKGGNQDRSLSNDAVIFPASITVTKDAVPDHSQDFAYTTTGGLTPSSFSLDDDSDPTLPNAQQWTGITSFVTYTVSETQVPGWSLSFANPPCIVTTGNGGSQSVSGSTVTINLKEGENVSCTFTNTRRQGSIELKKVWEGTPGTTTLTIGTSAGGSQVDSQLVSGANGTTGPNTVVTGTYFVSETDPGDYDAALQCLDGATPVSVGPNGSVEVGSDEAIVCTFTNTRRQGSIELKKVWEGTPGTTTLKIGTSAGGSQVDSHMVVATNGTTGANSVDTGTYFVSETDPGDYDTAVECSDGESEVGIGQDGSVQVGDDENVVCTFTNTRHQGSIELRKVWEGTPGSTTLNIGSAPGEDDVATQQTGEEGEEPLTTGLQSVDTGTYFVSESGGLGAFDSALECLNGEDSAEVGEDGAVAVGKDDVVVCTFTNTSLGSDIEVRKAASPTSVNPGDTVTYTYEVENTGELTLFDVTVIDNVLGDIGTIDVLEPGEVVTLEADFLVAEDSPTENVVEACGTDELDREVCDEDNELIQILLPAPPIERPRLPRTGFNLLSFIALGLNLIALGAAMMLSRRRWIA